MLPGILSLAAAMHLEIHWVYTRYLSSNKWDFINKNIMAITQPSQTINIINKNHFQILNANSLDTFKITKN